MNKRAIVVLKRSDVYRRDDSVRVLAVIPDAPEGLGWQEINDAIEEKFGDYAWHEVCEDVFKFEGPKWRIEDAHS